MQRARQIWERLALRERRLAVLAFSVIGLGLLWALGIAPALRTLRTAPAQMEALDTQLELMQKLAAQAKGLQSRPALTREDAVRALESSLQQRLGGSFQLNVAGERVTVVLKAAAPDLLAQWLSQARITARALVSQARLTRGTGGWDGTLTLDLPPSS